MFLCNIFNVNNLHKNIILIKTCKRVVIFKTILLPLSVILFKDGLTNGLYWKMSDLQSLFLMNLYLTLFDNKNLTWFLIVVSSFQTVLVLLLNFLKCIILFRASISHSQLKDTWFLNWLQLFFVVTGLIIEISLIVLTKTRSFLTLWKERPCWLSDILKNCFKNGKHSQRLLLNLH